MTIIRRPSPFSELLSLRTAMDRLFDETFFRPVTRGSAEGSQAMPLDIYTTPDALVVEASLPGIRPEDVDVSVLGDTLTLSASTATDQAHDQNGYHVREVRRGRFDRTVTLPSGLKTDAATASFENGMLTLSFPKAEQAKPRQIKVSTTSEGTAAPVTATPITATPIEATVGDAPKTTPAGEQPAGG